jgi:glutamyl-tRNA synthetase
MWDAFGFEPPRYAHILPLCIKDGNSYRKLSKRKDPEAAISFHHEKGVPKEGIKLYFATLINPDFDAWYLQNPDKDLLEFRFKFEKMSTSPPMFDMEKLINLSKNYLSRLTASELYDQFFEWTKEFDQDFNQLIDKQKDYTIALLNIEREQAKPRKDFAFYSEIKDQIWYMYDELFDQKIDYNLVNNKDDFKKIVNDYFDNYYDVKDDKENWFKKIKELAGAHGYASEMSDYKANPEKYQGNVADVSNMIRVALTTKTTTPDLYEIIKLLGIERIKQRIKKVDN